jgi:hypothetical protein
MEIYMEIVVTRDGHEIASGLLFVDTSTTPPTGNFTPNGKGASQVPAQVNSWSSSPKGATNWNFQVSDRANGDFPLGPLGTPFTYAFTGHENDQGTNPHGHVTWPKASITGGDTVEWQGGATQGEDESYAAGQAAS